MTRKLIYIAFSIVILITTSCINIRLRTANENYIRGAFAESVNDYEFVLSKRQDPEAISRIADAYRQMGNSYKSEFWYRKAVKLANAKIEYDLYLAEALMKNSKYNEAKEYLTNYLELNRNDIKAKQMLIACDSLFLFFRDTTLYTILPLRYNEKSVNNFSPTFYRHGIVFLSDIAQKGLTKTKSDMTGKRYYDLFYAKKTDRGNWVDLEPIRGNINGRFNEGPVAFNSDFSKMFLTRNNYLSNKIEKNRKSINVLKIYEANFVEGHYNILGALTLGDEESSFGHPALSKNDSILFFVSNMPWGYGGTDIYYVIKESNGWSSPMNLGPEVNTIGNEMFPFLMNDSTLYFATDGLSGLGGLDIHETKKLNGKWTAPFNLGYPINSSQDDFGFIVDSTSLNGYFTSAREGGNDKIYSFVKNPPKLVVNVNLVEQSTRIPIQNTKVVVKKDGVVLSNGFANANGLVRFFVEPDHEYQFVCENNNYYVRSSSISTIGKRFSDTLTSTIELKKVILNKPFVWYGLSFKKKSNTLKDASYDALDLLANLLKENSKLSVEVSSYTDSRGSDQDNLNLTTKRAEFIVQLLKEKGVNSNRLIAVGNGENKLLNKCTNGLLCIEEEHEINNRIEITVKAIGQ